MARPGRKRDMQITLPQPVIVKLPDHGRDEDGKRYDTVAPTAERLVMAGMNPVCDLKGARKMKVVADDQIGKAGIIRVNAAPLQWLASRQMLDHQDRERNTLLREAGERYYRHWYEGGLKGIGAQNLDRVFGGDVDPAYMIPTTEHAARHRLQYREARERMGGWLARIADAVICDEMRLADAGAIFGQYASSETRSAIALSILKGALTTLAEHFDMLSKPKRTRAWRA